MDERLIKLIEIQKQIRDYDLRNWVNWMKWLIIRRDTIISKLGAVGILDLIIDADAKAEVWLE